MAPVGTVPVKGFNKNCDGSLSGLGLIETTMVMPERSGHQFPAL